MTSSRPRLVASATALGLALVLTACGSSDGDSAESDGSSTAEITEAPAEGTTIEADAFSYTVPEGWEESQAGGAQALTVAIDGTDTDGFADNVNVVQDDSIVDYEGDELVAAIRKGLEANGVTGFDSFEPVTVDGEEAVHTTAIFEVSGMKYRTEQYAVSVGDAGYVITFSHNEDSEQADRDAVDRSILATWSWG